MKKYSWCDLILSSISFCLPLFPRMLSPAIGLLLLFWIFKGGFKERVLLFVNNKTALFFAGFYLLCLLGLAFSSNLIFGLKDLETKLSILIFPLVIPGIRNKIDLKFVLSFFILGCFLAALACFSKALYMFVYFKENTFFYENFSLFLHPSYFSVYLNLSILIVLFFNLNKLSFKWRILNLCLVVFFSVTVVFLSSKIGIICLPLPFILVYLYLWFVEKKYTTTLIHLFGFFLLFFLSFKFFIKETRFSTLTEISENYSDLLLKLSEEKNDSLSKMEYKITESNQIRYLVWIESVKLIKSNWIFGVGTGDIKDELLKQYESDNLWWIKERKLNAHNQFFQTWAALGIPGILFLFGGFIVGMIHAVKNKNFIYSGFLIVLFLNFLVESMLETQAGVIFFAFFNSLFCFIPFPKTGSGNLAQEQTFL